MTAFSPREIVSELDRFIIGQKDAKRAVHWRGPGRTDWQLLVEGDVLTMPFEPHAVDDAGHLYVLHNDGPDGLQVLARYDFERKAPSSGPVLRTPGFDFEGQLLTEFGGGPAQGPPRPDTARPGPPARRWPSTRRPWTGRGFGPVLGRFGP